MNGMTAWSGGEIAAVMLGVLPLVYLLGALLAVLVRRPVPEDAGPLPPLSVLKPLHGAEEGLEAALRSFCVQDYPDYQIVFGVPSPDDPALPVARRLMTEFPAREIDLVVGRAAAGANPKVNTLVNMVGHARYDILVLADSDVRMRTGGLGALARAFADPRVGAASCPYVARPGAGGLVPRLGALAVNGWFMPSVLVARALAPLDFCLGATGAVRRAALERIGGFHALAPYLADDYMLGKRVREAGFEVRLAESAVETAIPETRLGDLVAHEIRWARTIFHMAPWGHAGSVVTYFVPMALIPMLLWQTWEVGLAVLVVGTVLRLAIGLAMRGRFGAPIGWRAWWLLPLRDALGFFVWAAALVGRTVIWRGDRYRIDRDGRMERI